MTVRNALASANSAFPVYWDTLPKFRKLWLLRVEELVEHQKSARANCLIDEIGLPIQNAVFEFGKSLTLVRATADLHSNVRNERLPSDAPDKYSTSIRGPYENVAIITLFNVPPVKATLLIANALDIGNTVVHPPSELTPCLMVLFIEIVDDTGISVRSNKIFTRYGCNISDDITGHGNEDFIPFTGSRMNGQHITEGRARTANLYTLEPHSQSPTENLAAVFVKQAAPLAARSIFMMAEQSCIGSNRFYVTHLFYMDFVKRFAIPASKLGMGDIKNPSKVIAPFAARKKRDWVSKHTVDAVSKGVTMVIGGKWDGNRCESTLLSGVSEEVTVFIELRVDERNTGDQLKPQGLRPVLVGRTHSGADPGWIRRLSINREREIGVPYREAGFEPCECDDGILHGRFMTQMANQTFIHVEAVRNIVPIYMGLIKQIDDQLGELFTLMQERKPLVTTTIALSSDHSNYHGDYWMGDKLYFHDSYVKIPLFLAKLAMATEPGAVMCQIPRCKRSTCCRPSSNIFHDRG